MNTYRVMTFSLQTDLPYYYGDLLFKNRFKPREWKTHFSFYNDPDNLEWDAWVDRARRQAENIGKDGNPDIPVRWRK